ncbi:MAG: hypothetical protein QOJ73_7340 [Streptosporangiaceae bacterium]|nr:hypothetical protein [Streptosporangiaceae bacterium]
MVADPRVGDVAEAERLFSQADSEGAAPLPALSAAELWVLCGTDQVLAAESELRWWTGLAGPERAKLTAAMLDFLAYRKLLRPAGGDQPDARPEKRARVPMAAALAMIVAARQHPSVVAVSTAADGSAERTPRMHGLAENGQPLRAVVGEYVSRTVTKPLPLGPLHQFSLMSPRHAGYALAVWAEADASRPARWKRPRREATQVVDVYQHREGETLTRDRVTMTTVDGYHMVTRQRPGANPEPPAPCDQAGLATLLTSMLTRGQP